MRTILLRLAGCAALVTASATAAAESPKPDLDLKGGSAMVMRTDLDLDKCKVLDKNAEEGWIKRSCPGYGGIQVYVAEDDQRTFVSYGKTAAQEPAARQTFAPFNSIDTQLEWVLSGADSDHLKPVATILRFFLEPETGTPGANPRDHPVLVVTQLKPGAVCHIAYVDPRANPNAKRDAEFAAVRLAGSFDCANKPELVGPQTPGLLKK